MSTRALMQQLDRLEANDRNRTAAVAPFVVCISSVEPSALLEAEKIVIDCFRDTGDVTWARERITSNAQHADDTQHAGSVCPAGGFVEAVLQEVHGLCFWRTVTGSCQMCFGTPVAEPLPETVGLREGAPTAVTPPNSSQSQKWFEPEPDDPEYDGVPRAPLGSGIFEDVERGRRRREFARLNGGAR